MAYASHMNDTQHTSSLPINTTLCLFGGDFGCDWEQLCYPEKAMTSISSNSKAKMIGLQPVISRQIQTLASLESNYETSEDEEHMEKELEEMDQVGEGLADEDEMEDDFDEEDGDDDDDDNDYDEFCNFLTKSPACDAAASRFIHASFVTSGFSFSLTNADDSSEEEDAGDVREDTSENDSADEDECGWSAVQQTRYFGGFDPFAVSGLFMPSLLSTLAYGSPSIPDEKSCNSDNDSDCNEGEGKELAQKLEDINGRWFEMYSNSNDVSSTKVEDENCVTSKAVEVSCKKNVHFCDKMKFIDILNKEEWAEDYEVARKGPWEQYHRDHVRFENRIESVRELLSRVLVAEHRATVFQKLYETDDLVTDDLSSSIHLLLPLPASS